MNRGIQRKRNMVTKMLKLRVKLMVKKGFLKFNFKSVK